MHVVVALDGSSLSERPLQWLKALVPLGVDAVSLIAVSEAFEGAVEIRNGGEFFERECVLLNAYLRETAKNLHSSTGLAVDSEVRVGRADEEILKFAAEKEPGLLVISTHGRSGVSRWAVGSVADKVLRHAEVPVFVLGPHASARQPPQAVREILLPLDGSETAEDSLLLAREWAAKLGARVHLVRVVNYPTAYPEDTFMYAYTPELIRTMEEAAADYLAKVVARFEGISTLQVVSLGGTALELLEYVDRAGIDLAIMTSHARRGIARTVLGSTTDRMLQATCPLVVLPVS